MRNTHIGPTRARGRDAPDGSFRSRYHTYKTAMCFSPRVLDIRGAFDAAQHDLLISSLAGPREKARPEQTSENSTRFVAPPRVCTPIA